MKPIIIGLTGPRHCGKSTTANYLATSFNLTRVSFATPIKQMLNALCPSYDFTDMTESQKNAPIAHIGCTPRYLMQTLGTDWGRNLIDKDIWLKIMANTLESLPLSNGYVIDDIRFPNEAILVKSHGGFVFQLSRQGVEYDHSHASEHPLPNNLIDGTFNLPKNQTEISRWFRRHVESLPRNNNKGKLKL